MSVDGGMRASNEDREHAVEALQEAYAAGRLELGELRERAGAAYSARTWGDLRALTGDLPQDRAPRGPGRPRPSGPGRPPEPRGPRPAAGSGGRPFAPMLVMALIWLAIAALARAPQAVVMPLILLGAWGLCARTGAAPACRSCGRRRRAHRARTCSGARPGARQDHAC